MDPFEFSLSPYFNDVIRAAQVVDCDPTQSDNVRELQEHLEFNAKFAQLLAQKFQEAIKIRPNTALTKSAPPRFESALRSFTQALNLLNGYCDDHERQHLLDGIEQGRLAIKAMFNIFEEMRVEEEAFPQFSESPYIQELVRVATGVAKGQYPPETLQTKLEWMYQRHKEFCKDFDEMKQSPKECDEVATLLPVAEKALEHMGLGLDMMARYFKDRDRTNLKEGCAVLLQSSERLMKVEKRLMQLSVAQPAACPQCSEINPGGVKTCQSCGAIMPEIVGLSKHTMELRERQEGRPSYAYLSRLEGAVEGRLQNYISDEELKRQIDSFAKRAQQGRESFEKLTFPKEFDDDEARANAERSHELLDSGTKKILEGVEQLRHFFVESDRDDLVKGLETIYSGADDITASQEYSQAILMAEEAKAQK